MENLLDDTIHQLSSYDLLVLLFIFSTSHSIVNCNEARAET